MFIDSEDFDIEKIAESGQCFRLGRLSGNAFRLTAFGRVLDIIQDKGSEHAELLCSDEEYDLIWRSYFDMDTDYRAFRAAVPPQDRYLSEAAAYGKGIRILRQDPWEILISFIISQRKNIPAIRSCIEKLCSRFGQEIDGYPGYFDFPSPRVLSKADCEELACCSLGYRDKYVLNAAGAAAEGRLDLNALFAYSTDELFKRLTQLYGVGTKVANCILLFGYHRIEAFPVDVWIARVLSQHYPDGFPFERYDGFAGIMQQYMFFHARMAQETFGRNAK